MRAGRQDHGDSSGREGFKAPQNDHAPPILLAVGRVEMIHRFLIVASVALAIAVPALAHHSFGMFDMRPEAEIAVKGVIKQ